jgi:hypothetical protein
MQPEQMADGLPQRVSPNRPAMQVKMIEPHESHQRDNDGRNRIEKTDLLGVLIVVHGLVCFAIR